MPKVMVRHAASYDYDALKTTLFEIMDGLGGEKIIGQGARVCIKPNMLAPAPPERAMTTHPNVVRAAVEYVLHRGGVPTVSDSPAMGSFEKMMREGGYRKALEGLDVECRPFEASRVVDAGEPFHRLEIAEEALDADVLLNLAKLKTHGQMLLTLGVKNMFGCVVGYRKPEWHFRAGVDRAVFANLLVHIYKVVAPSLTILDGVLAMEGQGPGASGSPRNLGLLFGSDDAVALDATVCGMLGLSPESLLTNRAAEKLGLVKHPIEVDGALSGVRDFKLPEMASLLAGPRIVHGLLRRHLIQRPVVRQSVCRLCGECWKICPAKAISRQGKSLHLDYDACIRCYCCQEVCPHGAIKAEEPLAGKMLKMLIRAKRSGPSI